MSDFFTTPHRIGHYWVTKHTHTWIVAHQTPLSGFGFPRQEYWSGLTFSSPGDLPGQGTEHGSPALRADSLLAEPPGKPKSARRKHLSLGGLGLIPKMPEVCPLSRFPSRSTVEEFTPVYFWDEQAVFWKNQCVQIRLGPGHWCAAGSGHRQRTVLWGQQVPRLHPPAAHPPLQVYSKYAGLVGGFLKHPLSLTVAQVGGSQAHLLFFQVCWIGAPWTGVALWASTGRPWHSRSRPTCPCTPSSSTRSPSCRYGLSGRDRSDQPPFCQAFPSVVAPELASSSTWAASSLPSCPDSRSPLTLWWGAPCLEAPQAERGRAFLMPHGAGSFPQEALPKLVP